MIEVNTSKRSTNRLLGVRIIEDSLSFMALEKEWEDLYRNSSAATPFQSWAWLYSWWESYGEGYELRLVTIRDGKRLVGIIPLMLERWVGFSVRLLFIGSGLTCQHDVLAREGWEGLVSEAGSYALQQMNDWQVADLQQLPPTAVAWSLFQKWAGFRSRVWQDNCPVIDVKPWNEVVASLGRNLRSDVRRTLRRAEADGVLCKLASVEDAEQAGYRLIDLHRESRRGRSICKEHLTQRFESHMVSAAVRLSARGFGGISEVWQAGSVIASDFLLFGRDFIGGYLMGATREATQRYQMSSLFVCDAINIAHIRNSACVNMLRGEESYKLRWNPRIIPHYRAILGRSLLFSAIYVACSAIGFKTKYKLKHCKRIRVWVKTLTPRYRRYYARRRVDVGN